MIGMRGRVQKEGEVIHVIIRSHRRLWRPAAARRRDGLSPSSRARRRCDAQRRARPRAKKTWRPRDLYWPPHAGGADPEEIVRIRSRNFH